MTNLELYLLCYLLGSNILTFLCFGIDKHRAKQNGHGARRSRISEASLLLLALLGGALGAWMGMRVFRHKTQHRKFTILIPLILLAQVLGILYLAMQ